MTALLAFIRRQLNKHEMFQELPAIRPQPSKRTALEQNADCMKIRGTANL